MSSTTFADRVSVTIAGGIADVRMIRPDKRNALDGPMFLGLAEAGAHVAGRSDVRAVVLSGEGPSFCAGLDMSVMGQLAGGGGDRSTGNPGALTASGVTHLGQQVAWVWQEVPVPVIAAVQGHALGGGIQIALGADLRIVHPDTKMSVREVHWGLVPDMTGTLMLSQLVRADVLKELVFTARIFDGREALQLGLATRLSDDPLADATALAREIADRSPTAVRGSKHLVNHLLHHRAAEQFAEERRTINALVGSPNQIEAVMSNMEQRAPQFIDPE